MIHQKQKLILHVEREAERLWGVVEYKGKHISNTTQTEEQLIKAVKIDLLLQWGLYEYDYELEVRYVN
jgi:hypothetical protein